MLFPEYLRGGRNLPCAGCSDAEYTGPQSRPVLCCTLRTHSFAIGPLSDALSVTGVGNEQVSNVPTGKVKWYSVEKGFGFLSQDEGEDVHVSASALPKGVESLKPGQRVEFGMAAGRKGPQALTVKVLDPIPTIRRTAEQSTRPERAPKKFSADVLHGLIEDTIKTLESTIQPALQAGRYPDRTHSKKIAEVLRTLATELDH